MKESRQNSSEASQSNSTSDDNSSNTSKGFKVKIPKNSTENRLLKDGLIEDDNEDIAYLNFRLIWYLNLIKFLLKIL